MLIFTRNIVRIEYSNFIDELTMKFYLKKNFHGKKPILSS